VSVVLALFLGGLEEPRWRSARGSGDWALNAGLRWTIASQYQLPLGTFLGIGALVIVYATPVVSARWSIFRLDHRLDGKFQS